MGIAKLSTRIKLLFGSTKCDVRGYHENTAGDWQPALEYGKQFFRLKCDGCSKVLITAITKPKISCDGIVLTRWWGDVYPGLYGASLTATSGETKTCSSEGHVWTATWAPEEAQKPTAKKKTAKKKRKAAHA